MNIIIHAPSSKAVSQAFARDLATALRDAGHHVDVAEKFAVADRNPLTSAMNFIGQCDFLIAFVDAGGVHLYLTLGLAIGKDKKILLVPRAEAELPPMLDNVDKIVSDSHNEQLIFQILEHVGRCQIDFQSFLRSYTHYPEFFGDFNNKTLVDIVSQGCELKGYSPEINTDPTRPGYFFYLGTTRDSIKR